MEKPSDIPSRWWQEAVSIIHHPVSWVSLDHRFIFANNEFERLVGRSASELRGDKWMDITVSNDVEADLDSIADVASGKVASYTMAKRYRHKRGHEVPVDITVWRFPLGTSEPIRGYLVEAIPMNATTAELEQMRSETKTALLALEEKIERITMSRQERRRADKEGNWSSSRDTTVNVGNTVASEVIMRYVVLGAIMLIGAASYLIYIAGWPGHGGSAAPPNQPQRTQPHAPIGQ